MVDERWQTIGETDPEELVDSSLELHWAVQYIAAMGQTFAAERSDDSHRAMTWDAQRRLFVGVPMAGAYPFRVALRPEDMTLLLIDRLSETLGSFPLAGKSRQEGFEWLSLGMATYRGGSPPRITHPDWTMPDHAVRADEAFSTTNDDDRRVLAALYGTSADLMEEMFADRDGASTIRCWPHHFDIATLITLNESDSGEAKKTVGIGMAPSGGGYDSWYWYVTPWPYPDESKLSELQRGEWQTIGWTGAVLTGEAIAQLPAAERESAVRGFLEEAVAAATRALDED